MVMSWTPPGEDAHDADKQQNQTMQLLYEIARWISSNAQDSTSSHGECFVTELLQHLGFLGDEAPDDRPFGCIFDFGTKVLRQFSGVMPPLLQLFEYHMITTPSQADTCLFPNPITSSAFT